MRLRQLLSVLLALALLTAADDAGTHSTHFDPKYTLPTTLLLTPRTHPNLFSFTGRWQFTPTAHPRTPSYHATLWPGTSVTILVFGPTASIKLLPQPQGFVSSYRLHVSVDGGEEERYDLKDVDTSSSGGYFFDVKIPADNEDEIEPTRKLKPHTVKIVSTPDTPFSFEGVMVENMHITQGPSWLAAQDSRPIIEFVGEGIDAKRLGGFLLNQPSKEKITADPQDAIQGTQQYRLAEKMCLRHYHISAAVCLLSTCPGDIPGLATQYFNTSPHNTSASPFLPSNDWDPRHPSNLNAAWRFLGTSTKPPVHSAEADVVVVDLGILDIEIHQQPINTYTDTLREFLQRVMIYAHPSSKILVLSRSTNVPLFDATKGVVASFSATLPFTSSPSRNIAFAPLSSDDDEEYIRALCPHILAAGLQKNPHYRNAVCGGIAEVLTREKAHDLFWGLVVLLLVLGGLWVARVTVVGALAAVVGRGLLGLEAEEVEEEGRRSVKVV